MLRLVRIGINGNDYSLDWDTQTDVAEFPDDEEELAEEILEFLNKESLYDCGEGRFRLFWRK